MPFLPPNQQRQSTEGRTISSLLKIDPATHKMAGINTGLVVSAKGSGCVEAVGMLNVACESSLPGEGLATHSARTAFQAAAATGVTTHVLLVTTPVCERPTTLLTHTHRGQLSLASLWGCLIEYQLRLG